MSKSPEIEELEAVPIEEPKEKKSKDISIWILLLGVAYLISPIDIIPEAILGPIGLIDDGILFMWLVKKLTEKFRKTPK